MLLRDFYFRESKEFLTRQMGKSVVVRTKSTFKLVRDECVKFVRLESSNLWFGSGYTNKGNCISATLHALIEIERGHCTVIAFLLLAFACMYNADLVGSLK